MPGCMAGELVSPGSACSGRRSWRCASGASGEGTTALAVTGQGPPLVPAADTHLPVRHARCRATARSRPRQPSRAAAGWRAVPRPGERDASDPGRGTSGRLCPMRPLIHTRPM